MSQQLVSVVLPVHNQADHIVGIVDSYLGALARLPNPVEIVLVTNACTDSSPSVCAELAARDERVRTVDLAQGGWGRAVRAGLAEARGDVLCYTNSARTTAEMLTLALAYATAYPGVVLKAARRTRDSWRRRFGSVLYNLECRALFDLPVWDINGTPKVFSREHRDLLALSRDDDLIDLEFAWICTREEYPIVEIPILATARAGGKSTTNYKSAVKMYVGALDLRRRTRRG